jgi:hypothetical protein
VAEGEQAALAQVRKRWEARTKFGNLGSPARLSWHLNASRGGFIPSDTHCIANRFRAEIGVLHSKVFYFKFDSKTFDFLEALLTANIYKLRDLMSLNT